jgi:hypothetical protein
MDPYHHVQENMTLKYEVPRQLSENGQHIDTKTIAKLSVALLWTKVVTGVLFGVVVCTILGFLPIVVLVEHMFTSSLNYPVNL